MALPTYHSQLKELLLMQTQWSTQLNPLLDNPINNNNLLTNVPLSTGDNTINHLLNRKLVGWIIVGINAAATIYDKQATNQMANLTLVLNASAPCTVNLLVF